MFDSWQQLFDNQVKYIELMEYDDRSICRNTNNAREILLTAENSPYHKIDYQLGLDPDNPFNISEKSYIVTQRQPRLGYADVCDAIQAFDLDDLLPLLVVCHRGVIPSGLMMSRQSRGLSANLPGHERFRVFAGG